MYIVGRINLESNSRPVSFKSLIINSSSSSLLFIRVISSVNVILFILSFFLSLLSQFNFIKIISKAQLRRDDKSRPPCFTPFLTGKNSTIILIIIFTHKLYFKNSLSWYHKFAIQRIKDLSAVNKD